MLKSFNFKPGPQLTFKSVIAVRSKLYKALMEHTTGAFCLDLSEVVACDSAGLALLIDIRRLCTLNNKNFEIIGMSAQTQSLAEFCGVKNIVISPSLCLDEAPV